MPSLTIAAVVALASAMPVVTAQRKPDFSGEWRLNRQASTLSPAVAAAAQSGALKIEHRDPAFKCQMTIVLDGKPIETKYELLTDGREVTSTAGGRRTVSSLRWDSNALVATSRVEIPNGEMTIVFRYELLDDGRRLRASEQLRGAGRDQDNVWVFDRQSFVSVRAAVTVKWRRRSS
jgi:hypothetical protein